MASELRPGGRVRDRGHAFVYQHVHLLVNEASGTGHGAGEVVRIRRFLEGAFEGVQVSVVSDHPSAAERAREIVRGSPGPAVIFAGGAGGRSAA